MTGATATIAVPVATVWTDPDAVRAVDGPAVGDRPDPAAWSAAMTHEQRLDLVGRVETQALLGEAVIALEERRGWTRVLLPEQPSDKDAGGYPGWVRTAHLAPPPAGSGDEVTVTTRLVAAADRAGRRVVLSYGTRLPGEDRGDRLRVLLHAPDGPLEVPAAAVAAVAPIGSDVLASARVFVGLAYLWGGRSGWGVDCSGLSHLAWRAAGVTIGRDADDQAAGGAAVPAAEAAPGDLVFFSRPGEVPHHVAIHAAPGRMLHSPGTGRQVEELSTAAEPYRSELDPYVRRYGS